MTTEKKSRVNADLDRHLKALLAEVMAKPKDDQEGASLTDKCKIIDRVLKWEQIKHHLQDGEWGSAFSE
jgi:hypothetical protein